ncbi:hypothetical protein V3G39_05895 [Dermatophilaceae bacterium Sec6.4]
MPSDFSRIPLRYNAAERRLARSVYESVEPLHVIAYFNPAIREQQQRTGLSSMARYLGGRGAPLGDCPAACVSATFFNFNPAAVEPAWQEARKYGLDRLYRLHLEAIEGSLREALGPLCEDPSLPALARRFGEIAAGLSYAGRPLAAAWSVTPVPDEPHLALWQCFAALREYRGDGHIAALVQSGLSGVQALAFHESPHPDPALRRRALGSDFSRKSRGWSTQEWDAALAALTDRGLLDADGTISPLGAELYAALEEATDDAAAGAYAEVADAAELVSACRPFVKAVIDAGMLPGTVKRVEKA